MNGRSFVIILVDALGWDLAQRRAGFLAALPERRRLDTVLGFSSAALPSLFTGAMPSTHGQWLMYRRASRDGVFAPLAALRWAPRRVRESYKVGRALHRLIEWGGIDAYFQLYQVPRALLPAFDLAQRRDIFRPKALEPDSLWDTLERSGLPVRVWQWRTPEAQSLEAVVEKARGGERAVLFCYTAELDAALHREGSGGDGVARHLDRYERAVQALHAANDGHWVYLLSDHGMVDVLGTVDVMGALAPLPARWPRDYLAFFDSTFARFWWRDRAARAPVLDALTRLGHGHWMDDAELGRHGVLFPGREYGEDIFLLDPGWLMVPSFMGSEALKGMHGYHPDHPQMSAALFSNRPLPQGLGHVCQVRAFLESELAAFRGGGVKRGEIAQTVSRGGFYITVEQLAGLVSGVVYTVVVLRWLGPYAYGVLALAMALAGLATIGAGNFEMFLERYAAEYQARGELATLARAHRIALGAKFVLGLLSGVLLWLISGSLARHFGLTDLERLLPALLPLVISDAFNTTARATLFGMQQFGWVASIALAFHAVKILMVLILWSMARGVLALALGIGILALAQGLLASLIPLWMLRGQTRTHWAPPPRSLLRTMWSYCMPLLGARIAFLSGQNLSKVVLGKLFTPELLGYFTFAFQTVERFIALVYSLPYALLPSLTQLVALGERDRLRWITGQACRLIGVAAAGMSVLIFVFAPELTLWLAGPRFQQAVPLLRIMALVPWVRTAHQPLTMLLQAMRRPGAVFALALVKLVGEFGCYFLLIPALGLLGAGWANWIGAALAFLAAMIWVGVVLPEGRGERWLHYAQTTVLVLPLLAAGLWIDGHLHGHWAGVLKLLVAPVFVLGVFALGLVNAHDLEKVQGLTLPAAWMVRARDGLVRAGYSLLRVTSLREARW